MNPAVEALVPSLIRDINTRKRPGDIDLGLGEPVDKPSVTPFEVATRWVAEHGCPYTPNAGFPDLRFAIAQYLARPHQREAAHVVVTHGSQQALHLAVKTLLTPGEDEVLIPEPAYGAYAKLAQLEGLEVTGVSGGEQGLFAPSARGVLAALTPRTRLIVLASPGNPTGRVWGRDELAELARGLAARPGPPVWLLMDEAYRELLWEGSLGQPSEHYHHCLAVGSLSKGFGLTGLRLGWLVGPAEVISAAIKVQQQTITAASTFSQRVGLEVLTHPQRYLIPRERWVARRLITLAGLAELGLTHAPLEGAFYAWVQLPERWRSSSLAAALHLLEHRRVATIPGVAFGACGEGWLRLSWAGDEAQLADGIRRVGQGLAGG